MKVMHCLNRNRIRDSYHRLPTNWSTFGGDWPGVIGLEPARTTQFKVLRIKRNFLLHRVEVSLMHMLKMYWPIATRLAFEYSSKIYQTAW